jgi:hypothetical protein
MPGVRKLPVGKKQIRLPLTEILQGFTNRG